MANIKDSQKSYFELTEHNLAQVIVVAILMTAGIIGIFSILLPQLNDFFVSFLDGRVYNDGSQVGLALESKESPKYTNYLFSWAVDIYLKTPAEARYWFNPVLSLLIPISFVSFFIAFLVTTILPRNLGYIRQKIEREIASSLDKIATLDGSNERGGHEDIAKQILFADLKDLYQFVDQWNIPIEDLKSLHNALIWRESSLFYKILNINDAIRFYMRFHFTVKYNNTVLGLVYMGAAVLIIIVGLRGLKFIPPSHPTFVILALGLEFTMLLVYAITVMYSRQDEDLEYEKKPQREPSMLSGTDFGNAKEVENLLKVFVKSKDSRKN